MANLRTLLDVDASVNPGLKPASSGTVPLTIICGFLGAGKSTLVRCGTGSPLSATSQVADSSSLDRRILSERHGYRIAVIMNDFGDTAVSRLLSHQSPF